MTVPKAHGLKRKLEQASVIKHSGPHPLQAQAQSLLVGWAKIENLHSCSILQLQQLERHSGMKQPGVFKTERGRANGSLRSSICKMNITALLLLLEHEELTPGSLAELNNFCYIFQSFPPTCTTPSTPTGFHRLGLRALVGVEILDPSLPSPPPYY